MKLVCSFVAVAVAGSMAWAADPGFRPVLAASNALMGMRMVASDLAEGRFALVQVRLAVPAESAVKGDAAQAEPVRWRLSTESTYAVDCLTQPTQVGLVQRAQNTQANHALAPEWRLLLDAGGKVSLADLPMQPLQGPKSDSTRQGMDLGRTIPEPVPEQGTTVRTPPELTAAAAFACLVARNRQTEADAAAWVQKTAGLPTVAEYSCSVQNKETGVASTMSIAYAEFPPVVRLEDKWLSKGLLTPDYIAVADAGLEVRLMRTTGKLRVVARAESVSLGTGECALMAPMPLHNAKKYRSGW
ncbi:MAG: hypothetical protein K2W33_20105 [Burkholderiales bacterium]|nr:hypothetical protein [Burkholderiales bacterium]